MLSPHALLEHFAIPERRRVVRCHNHSNPLFASFVQILGGDEGDLMPGRFPNHSNAIVAGPFSPCIRRKTRFSGAHRNAIPWRKVPEPRRNPKSAPGKFRKGALAVTASCFFRPQKTLNSGKKSPSVKGQNCLSSVVHGTRLPTGRLVLNILITGLAGSSPRVDQE